MSKAVVLQHVPYEGPARIVPILRDYGIPLEIRHLYRGDSPPASLDEVRILIVMGGPMGVADIGDSRYPFLAPELELIRQAVAADHPFLGICLGAQLLAHAAGAKVYPNTRPGPSPSDPPLAAPEIGWGPVRLPFPGGTEPILMGARDGAPMFHWHFDTFDLPKLPAAASASGPASTGSVLLSSTPTCKNQAMRLKTRMFGFQYHMEIDQPGIEALLSHGQEDVHKVLGQKGLEQIRQDTQRYYPEHERVGNRIICNLLQYLKLY
jgi:GMP synthase (glutamine-hydrolysing)